jgi:AhpD family alkylhydroperoxidase
MLSVPSSEHGPLPLAPVEHPRNLFVRALYFATRRRYGVTPTAFRVVYARAPWIAFVSVCVALVVERCLSIDQDLRFLVTLYVAMRNGCTFCVDITRAEAVRARIGRERFGALLDFEASTAFSPREKAALAYAASLHESLHVGDDVLTRVRAQFSERELVEIVWTCAVARYFNAIALPLRIGSDGLERGSPAR